MKKIVFVFLLLISFVGFSQEWKATFEDAKEQAQKENKKIILVFSGSDWCAPCIKLDRNVWQSKEFQEVSNQKWVLYRADFPKKKGNALSKEQTLLNKILADKYNKAGYFPLVVVLDETGKVQGMSGYRNETANEYIEVIKGLER